jgi:hypothetical protein
MHSVRQILPKKPKTPSINFRRRKKWHQTVGKLVNNNARS